jgi:hypothetical protein
MIIKKAHEYYACLWYGETVKHLTYIRIHLLISKSHLHLISTGECSDSSSTSYDCPLLQLHHPLPTYLRLRHLLLLGLTVEVLTDI